MKLFCLVVLCLTAYMNNAAPTEGPDYREKYDHLLMEMINERIMEGERFLEHLNSQVLEFQKTKSEDIRTHVQGELDYIVPLVTSTDKYFTAELLKTGLDILERYSVEKAKAHCDSLIKALAAVQAIIKKAFLNAVFATEEPIDWRQEYDRELFKTINEHIVRADGLLLGLNRQLQEYLKTKDVHIKDQITNEVDFMIPMLKLTSDHAEKELLRTDLDFVERFLYEKAADEVKLLSNHYTQIEKALKGVISYTQYLEATAEPIIDWRSEYDRLLFEDVEMNLERADGFLLRLARQANEYTKTKDKSLADRVINEVEFTVPMVNSAITRVTDQLKRTDLNHVETYLYEKARDEATLLVKYYKLVEAEVKKP